MRWAVIDNRDGIRCVFPTDDFREHVLSSDCWCKPRNDNGVLVHNSMDRREEYERGRKVS